MNIKSKDISYQISLQMNFYDSLTYIWGFGRLYGLNYFTNHKNELKITNISFIRSLIPGISFILISLIGLFIIRPNESEYQVFGRDVMYVVGRIGVIVQFTACIIIFVTSFTHRKDLMKFYEAVYELDNILLNNLEINLDYRKMKINGRKRLFSVQTGFCIVSCIIDYAYTSNASYIIILVVYSYSAAVNIINSLEFINCAKIIKIRFKLLNDLLITTKVLTPNDLEIMIKCHVTLNGLICNLNEIYGSRLLFSITNDFVIIISQLYSFFVTIDTSFNDSLHVKYLYGSLMLPSLMAKLYFTSTNCQKALSNKNNFGKSLRKFENSKMTMEISYMVIRYFINNLKTHSCTFLLD